MIEGLQYCGWGIDEGCGWSIYVELRVKGCVIIEAIRAMGECAAGGVLNEDALIDGICQRLGHRAASTKTRIGTWRSGRVAWSGGIYGLAR